MKPMLLQEAPCYSQKIKSQGHVYVQPKLDGWRAVINTRTGTIYSRSGKVLSLPHITRDILSISGLPEWIDGELYAHGYTLGEVASMIRKSNTRIKFYCFDAIIPGPFSRRLEAVKSIRETENVRTVSTAKIAPYEIDRCYRDYLSQGLEGAVIRLDGVEYFQGRSENIFKLKPSIYTSQLFS